MIYDVLVIGAGPGGMQAAIAAASEGLKTLVLERDKVGGQIGQTPKLENSVFANGGLTGPQFATMMREQADRMGVEFHYGDAFSLRATKKSVVVGVKIGLSPAHVRIEHYTARTVVLAMGNKWNDIDIPGMKEGMAAGLVKIGPVDCLHADVKGKDVAVFGGGPAAGQAILELALKARRVHVIMRSHYRMPQYLIDRMEALDNVVTHPHTTYHHDGRCHCLQSVGNDPCISSVEVLFLLLQWPQARDRLAEGREGHTT
jgi:thioredoxin reductase (NADPH)